MFNLYDTLITNFNEFRPNIVGLNKSKYFDYTASGLAYNTIEQRIMRVLQTYANTHSHEASNAKITQKYYDDARDIIRDCLNINKDFCVLPSGTGTTSAIRHFQKLMGIYLPPNTRLRVTPTNDIPLVIVGPFEHHSNEVSYREALCDVVRIKLKNGNVDLYDLKQVLDSNRGREIIGSFSYMSNVTGVITPYKEIYKMIKQYNGIVCFDCAASSPYYNIDSNYYDAIVMSPHKLVGGPGSCGLLIIRKDILKGRTPTFAGGGTVDYVNKNMQVYQTDIEVIEDAGTPGILQLIRASLAYKLRNDVGLSVIQEKKYYNTKYFMDSIHKLKNIDIYSPYDNNGIISLNIKNRNPYNVCDMLSTKYGLQTRAGCSCAGPYGHDILGLDGFDITKRPGWLRISLHYSHLETDMDFLVQSLKELSSY